MVALFWPLSVPCAQRFGTPRVFASQTSLDGAGCAAAVAVQPQRNAPVTFRTNASVPAWSN